jgi:hypothetical protein
MCQVKSMIVLKKKVFCPLDYNHHTDMLKELEIEDTNENALTKFVRVEITPKDGDLFNHNLDNWELHVDQDVRPDWFDVFEAEQRCKEELQKWFTERFIIDNKDWQRKEGILYVRNSNVEAYGSSNVKAFGSSNVEAYDSSNVKAYGSSNVKAYGSSNVKAFGSSNVKAFGSSNVEAYGSSNVEAFGSSNVKAYGSSNVVFTRWSSNNVKNIKLSDSATLKQMNNGENIIYVAKSADFKIKKI